MPKGAPKPTAVPMVSRPCPNLQYLSLLRARTHESPVPDSEPLGEGVEGNVAARALRVVVGRAHLARGGVEAAAGSGGREACDGAGEHLYLMSGVSHGNSNVCAYFDVRFVGALSGDCQCSACSNGCSRDVKVQQEMLTSEQAALALKPQAAKINLDRHARHVPMRPVRYSRSLFV